MSVIVLTSTIERKCCFPVELSNETNNITAHDDNINIVVEQETDLEA